MGEDRQAAPRGSNGQESRRDFLVRIARGVTYTAPLVHTFAAPPAAAAQTSGMMSMLTICDFFPALCRWLGGNQVSTFSLDQGQPGAPPVVPPGAPPGPSAPWSAPPPWSGSSM